MLYLAHTGVHEGSWEAWTLWWLMSLVGTRTQGLGSPVIGHLDKTRKKQSLGPGGGVQVICSQGAATPFLGSPGIFHKEGFL